MAFLGGRSPSGRAGTNSAVVRPSRAQRAGSILSRWIGPAVSVLAFGGFAVFLVLRLQEGFQRRAAEWFESVDEVPEEREEVVSRAIEFTFDEQGRAVLRGRAEQALGRSDGQQRFVEVEVRLLEVHDDGDAVVAADELTIDTRTEALEFLGNALLSVEGLELSGPHLHFRRAPDRLWSNDPVQFRSEDFVGIAASMQFDMATGDVSLRGVVAIPPEEDGCSVVAERARFDRETADTTLSEDVEVACGRLELTSEERVVARRDPGRGLTRAIEAGFGTELRLAGSAGEDEADPGVDRDDVPAVLRGDELEIELEDGRFPRLVHVKDNPSFSGGSGAELRGEEGRLALDREGRPEWLRMTGGVTSRLPAGEEGRNLVLVDSDRLEVEFDDEGTIAATVFGGGVRARYGRASATAESARWNGADTLVLEGAPRVVDSSLLELEGADLRLIVAESSRVEANGAVSARFLPARLDWLPGRFDRAVLTGDSAVIETGTGQGAFTGSVRLLFGRNRLLSHELRVDAEQRTLDASGEVVTSLELEIPAPEEPALDEQDSGFELPAAAAPAPAEEGATARAGAAPTADEPPASFVFSAWAGQFRYEASEGRLSYRGTPRIERGEPSGEVSSLVAGRIEADLAADGTLGAVRGGQSARFQRGDNLVRGSRIRYEPGPDVLFAWGSPAVVEVDGRSSEGGLLELSLAHNRSDIHPTRAGRAVTRARIRNPGTGTPR